ncbi:sugar phosphate nucleotidyltransferase [Methylogaea oryzae]|uniref:sugar phosphate nucleotidyltransferase n=1 Tax=Methylogaea oryzae TaxID=1295382 RepID=UPI000ABA1CD6|nr:sugar phosphate nucleotidyltransferase [Methylogaea oryzae]
MKDWKIVALAAEASMKEALAVIDKGAMQIALVVDGEEHLLGTVTDGDIRRALLRGEPLDTPVSRFMSANPYTGLLEEDEDIWQRTMQRYSLKHLPLLDSTGRVRGLATYVPPAEPRRPNWVVLMAGGLGSRLGPLTQHQPKPLLKVGEKPILETIIENFLAQGFYRFYICINYKGQMIRDYFGDGSRWDAEITYVEENRRMGTAGALSLLPEAPQLPLIVMNGDLLTKVDFVRLLQFHRRNQAAATLCVREHSHTVPYGVVEMDGYAVTGLVEKRPSVITSTPASTCSTPTCWDASPATAITTCRPAQRPVGREAAGVQFSLARILDRYRPHGRFRAGADRLRRDLGRAVNGRRPSSRGVAV